MSQALVSHTLHYRAISQIGEALDLHVHVTTAVTLAVETLGCTHFANFGWWRLKLVWWRQKLGAADTFLGTLWARNILAILQLQLTEPLSRDSDLCEARANTFVTVWQKSAGGR